MLLLTENAIDVIEVLTGGDAGLRLFVTEPRNARLQATVTSEPLPGDDVMDAQGVRLYLDAEASRRLDGKVLDADVRERSVMFNVIDRVRSRARARRGPQPQLARWVQSGTWFRSSSAQ
jgi:Fe-S cluster assembly iron-binding protein IscA